MSINTKKHFKTNSIIGNSLIAFGVFFSSTSYATDNNLKVEVCEPSSCQPLAVQTSDGEILIECARPCKSNLMTKESSCAAEKNITQKENAKAIQR